MPINFSELMSRVKRRKNESTRRDRTAEGRRLALNRLNQVGGRTSFFFGISFLFLKKYITTELTV